MQKKSIPAVTSDVKYMIKGTGLPAWSVFIAAVDFFHNKTRAVVGQRSSPAGYILYCNIFIIKKIKMK